MARSEMSQVLGNTVFAFQTGKAELAPAREKGWELAEETPGWRRSGGCEASGGAGAVELSGKERLSSC